MSSARNHWLIKSDVDEFSFADLQASPGRTAAWDGVRNYEARNSLRDMRRGELVFFYHSGAEPPGIAGIARAVREAYPDPTQFERGHERFDPRSKPDDPTWLAVDIRAVEPLPRTVSLDELKQDPSTAVLRVCQRGSRLSVHPVSEASWLGVLALTKRKSKP